MKNENTTRQQMSGGNNACKGNGIHDTGGSHSFVYDGQRHTHCYYCGALDPMLDDLEEDFEEAHTAPSCKGCEGTGGITLPAHQAWSPSRGTYIEDEVDIVCKYCGGTGLEGYRP